MSECCTPDRSTIDTADPTDITVHADEPLLTRAAPARTLIDIPVEPFVMSGANDIVERGLGGDTTAQKDLADYLGPDASVNVNKQIPIALAFQNAGCS